MAQSPGRIPVQGPEEGDEQVITLNLRTVLRWFLGLLFAWAAITKIPFHTKFLDSILAYGLPLPLGSQDLAASVVPWLELLCGLMLIGNIWAESALAVMVLLFGFFILATGQAWVRGLDIACGCFDFSMFGVPPDSAFVRFIESVQVAFFRNILLTAGAAYLFLHSLKLGRAAAAPHGETEAPASSA